MAYRNDVPADANVVRGVSGDLTLMRTNYAILASIVSGMTAPAEGAAMSQLLVTSGTSTFGMGWNGVNGVLLFSGGVVATINGLGMAGASAATTDTHYTRRGEVKTETLGGQVVELASGAEYTLDERAMYAYTIDELHAKTASGTVTVTLKIGATTVSGLDVVTISGTQSSTASTDAFTVASGANVSLVLGEALATSDLTFTIQTTRS